MKNSRGVALIVVLGVIILIITLSVMSVNFALSNFTLTSRVTDGTKAFFFAEAGIQRACFKIKNDNLTSPEDWPFAGTTVNIVVNATAQPNIYEVISSSTYGATTITKRIKAKITKGPPLTLLEWQLQN